MICLRLGDVAVVRLPPFWSLFAWLRSVVFSFVTRSVPCMDAVKDLGAKDGGPLTPATGDAEGVVDRMAGLSVP